MAITAFQKDEVGSRGERAKWEPRKLTKQEMMGS